MAEKLCSFFVTVLAAFLVLKSNAQLAQSSSEVVTLLNAYSSPLNLTRGRIFLAKVHDSEIGLCLNLTNNETKHQSSRADTSLASLYVRLTNYTTIKDDVFTFPCMSCPNLSSRSPTAEFVLNNDNRDNITCLAGSRFAEDFQITEQNPLRLSDVLSLSLYDADSVRLASLGQGEAVHLELPLAKMPNNSRAFKLKCALRSLNSSQWISSFCITNQTLKVDSQTHFVQCNCTTLGYFAVFVEYLNNSGGNPAPTTHSINVPYARLSLSLDAECEIYLSNATTKDDFLNSTKYSISLALNTSLNNIINMDANCGSIVVNFTLLSPDGTNATLNEELLEFSNLVKSDSFKVPVENSNIWPLTLRMSANYNLTIPTSIVSLYYIRKTATTPPIKTTEVQPLVVDYTPFMMGVAVVLFVVIACVCGTCCAHSWYLNKKKYTEFNSDKVKPKIVEPVVEEEEEEVIPPEFPMTFREQPQVNERQMIKYDWARTSFAHEQSDTSAFVIGAGGVEPKLIMDYDSDEASGSQLPPGDVAISIDETSEESESSEESGESSSDDYDTDDYDPRNYECEDDFDEAVVASPPRLEENVMQESEDKGQEQDGRETEERQEGDRTEENERENEESEKKETEERDERQKEEENQNVDDDVNNGEDKQGQNIDEDAQDVIQDDVTQDVTQDDVTQDDVTQDVTQDDVTQDVTQDDVTQDDVIEDDDRKDDDGTNVDPEGASSRAPSRSEGVSSRMDGAMTTNKGMPEPSL